MIYIFDLILKKTAGSSSLPSLCLHKTECQTSGAAKHHNHQLEVNMRHRWFVLFVLFFIAIFYLPGHGHQLGQSYIFLKIYDHSIHGRLEVPVSDLNKALGLDFRTDGSVTNEDVDRHIAVIKLYLLEKVRMAPNGKAMALRLVGHSLFSVSLGQYVTVEFAIDDLAEEPKHIDVDYAVVFDVDEKHRGLLVIEHNWKTNTFNTESLALIFSPSNRSQRLDLSSSSVWNGFMGLIELGIHHIWEGIDHILFLMALLLPSVVSRNARQWEPTGKFRASLIHVVKIVTFFTLAHSVTLSLAALEFVQLPSRLVESMIAISITVAAVDIVFPILRGRLLWVVFAFGLFHGFGFASVLSSMGISSTYMPLSLLGFNLGVEFGQVAIVSLAFPILFVISRRQFYTRYLLASGAILLIIISLYWFVERAFQVDLPAGELLRSIIYFWS